MVGPRTRVLLTLPLNIIQMHQLQATTRLNSGMCDSRNYSGEHIIIEQNSSEQLQDAPTIYKSNRRTKKYVSFRQTGVLTDIQR